MNKGELELWKATLLSWSTRRRVTVGPWKEMDGGSGVRRFRCETVIPWDDVWIEFDGSSEALLSVDGVAQFGINLNHRRTPLISGKGRAVVLELERVQTGQMGVIVGDGSLGQVDFIERDDLALRCFYDIEVLIEWIEQVGITDKEKKLLEEGLRETFMPLALGQIDVDGLRVYARRPNAPAEEQGLRLALSLGNVIGATRWSREEKDTALSHISKTLHAIYEELAMGDQRLTEVLAIGHAHIDLAWLWRYEETKRKVQRTFCSQIDLLERYDGWHFGASTPQYYENLFNDPPTVEKITSLVSAGRIEPLGAFWVESDCQLVDAPSLIRQLKFGINWFERHLGHRCRVAFLPDTFGFSSGLPTLLKAAGVELLVTTKLNWNDTNEFPWTNFIWVGPDSSEIEVQIFGANVGGYNSTMTIADLIRSSEEYRRRGGMGPALYTFGHGDGGGGPDEEMLERLRRYKVLPHLPKFVDLRVDDLIKTDRSVLPRMRGDMYLEYHRGVFSSQSKSKALIQSTQDALVATELWHCVVPKHSNDRFEGAWKAVLRSNFHDIIPGSSISQVYEDLDLELKEVLDDLERRDQKLFSAIFGEGADDVIVFGNRSGTFRPKGSVMIDRSADFEVLVGQSWERALPITGNRSRVVIGELEPFEVRSYLVRETSPKRLTMRSTRSRWTRTCGDLEVCITGEGIESLTFKGRELLTRTAGVVAWRQHPIAFDAWELVDPRYRVTVPLTHADVTIEHESRDLAVLLLKHVWLGVEVAERIVIGTDPLRVDIEVDAHMGERRTVLQYSVPTNIVSMRLFRGTNFGVDEVPTVPGDPRDAAKFEWPAHRFVDLSEQDMGLSVFNKTRFGHSVDASTVTVTLATSPLFPDPKAELDSFSEVALFPHERSWSESMILAHSHAFSRVPMVQFMRGSNVGAFQPVKGLDEGVVILGSCEAQDGSEDVICYLQESYGARHRFNLSFHKPLEAAFLSNLVEEVVGEPLRVSGDGGVELEILPWTLTVVRLRLQNH